VAEVEKHTLDGASTITLMKHKHRHVALVKRTRWVAPARSVVLRWLTRWLIDKMHGGEGGCEGPGVI